MNAKIINAQERSPQRELSTFTVGDAIECIRSNTNGLGKRYVITWGGKVKRGQTQVRSLRYLEIHDTDGIVVRTQGEIDKDDRFKHLGNIYRVEFLLD